MMIILLLLVHGIAGSFQMVGIISGGSVLLKVLTWIMFSMIVVHMVIGVVFTIQTLKASRKTGVYYFRENILFWIRRISGFVLILLVALHLIVFVETGNAVFRLGYFGVPQLIFQVLMLLALALHLLSNIKPLAIAMGLYSGKGYSRDVLLILAIVLMFCAVAFVVYYLRWAILWK
jgi:succinate dehydrogenase hydrophobic anchor subunit